MTINQIALITVVSLILIFFILWGEKKAFDQNKFVKDQCVSTTLFVISDHGHPKRVYECEPLNSNRGVSK